MRPSNDDICQLFEWLYLGGERNIRKTIPFITVWFDFRHNTNYPKNFVIPSTIEYIHRPFDDGDLQQAIPIWKQTFNEIQEFRKQGKIIFISCTEGISRSAVLAIWLVSNEMKSYQKAIKYIKSKRNIYPHKNFEPFLFELQKQYPSH